MNYNSDKPSKTKRKRSSTSIVPQLSHMEGQYVSCTKQKAESRQQEVAEKILPFT